MSIGHYVLTLTPEQEDRVLTNHMVPGAIRGTGGERCLMGVALNVNTVSRSQVIMPSQGRRCLQWPMNWYQRGMPGPALMLGDRYDALCKRFGTDRINAAIRSRIWSNRASRTLRAVGALVA